MSKAITHKCIQQVADALAKQNGTFYGLGLTINLSSGETVPDVLYIATEKVDRKSRVKPPLVRATFCPFCGESLSPAKEVRLKPADTPAPGNEDLGTCLKCGEPYQLVRPGKSQPTCVCDEGPVCAG